MLRHPLTGFGEVSVECLYSLLSNAHLFVVDVVDEAALQSLTVIQSRNRSLQVALKLCKSLVVVIFHKLNERLAVVAAVVVGTPTVETVLNRADVVLEVIERALAVRRLDIVLVLARVRIADLCVGDLVTDVLTSSDDDGVHGCLPSTVSTSGVACCKEVLTIGIVAAVDGCCVFEFLHAVLVFLGRVFVPRHFHLPALVAQVKGDDLCEDQFLFTGDIGIDLCEFIVSLVGLQCVDSAVGTIAKANAKDSRLVDIFFSIMYYC